LAQVSNDDVPKKLEPLTVPRIIEQLERALMDIKYKQSDDEFAFNNIENVPLESKTRPQFIGKELMLFEMIGILNGKITELQKKYQKLKSLEDREEEFVSSKANQITEPVQDILEYAKLAKSGQMDPKEALDGVLGLAKKLQNVTTVVLDTNRVTNDSLRLSKNNLNVNQIISDSIDSVKSTNVTIPIRVGLDHDVEVPVDRIRLGQVIQTILNNSIKHTKTGYIKVESFVAHQQNLFIIRINDTGTGIPKEILPNIFDKEISKNRIEGYDTRLSLYLCKGIIEAHGGKITVKNNADCGCTFTITLPLKNN